MFMEGQEWAKNLDRQRQGTHAVSLSLSLKPAVSESAVSIGPNNAT